MSRRRTKTKQNVRDPEPSDQSDRPAEVERAGTGLGGSASTEPSTNVKTWLSIWVPFHLVAIGVSFTAVVEPSSIHQRLSDLFHPYLRPMHFSADDRPVYLTHGDSDDQPHRIEVTKQPVSGLDQSELVDWRAVGPGEAQRFASMPGLAVSDRVARWLATAAMLAENDQPSMVADLLLPVVVKDPEITAVRIVRYPTDLNDINTEITVPYLARVLRSGDSVWLVQLKESRLSAQPRLSVSRSFPAFDNGLLVSLEAGVLSSKADRQLTDLRSGEAVSLGLHEGGR